MQLITKEQVLDDERLYTLMCEVEAIVNSRPITKVSDDPKDVSKVSDDPVVAPERIPPSPRCIYHQRYILASQMEASPIPC